MQTTATAVRLSAPPGSAAQGQPSSAPGDAGQEDFARHLQPEGEDGEASDPDAPTALDTIAFLMPGRVPLQDFRALSAAEALQASGSGGAEGQALDWAGDKAVSVAHGADPAATVWPTTLAEGQGPAPDGPQALTAIAAPHGAKDVVAEASAPPVSVATAPAEDAPYAATGRAPDAPQLGAHLPPGNLPADLTPGSDTQRVASPLTESFATPAAGPPPAGDMQRRNLLPSGFASTIPILSAPDDPIASSDRPDPDPKPDPVATQTERPTEAGRTARLTEGVDALSPASLSATDPAVRSTGEGPLRDAEALSMQLPRLWQVLLASEAEDRGADPTLPAARGHGASSDVPRLTGPRADGSGLVLNAPITAFANAPYGTVPPDPLSVSGLALEALLQGDASFAGAAPAGSLASAPGAALSAPMLQTAMPQLATQIGAMLAQRSDGTTEFTLSPEELGRVRVILQPETATSDRVIVMLSFDRPETMDLFRRHADQLSAALEAAGYSGSSIGFSQSDGGNDRGAGTSHGRPLPEDPGDDPARPNPSPLRASAHGTLDLRL